MTNLVEINNVKLLNDIYDKMRIDINNNIIIKFISDLHSKIISNDFTIGIINNTYIGTVNIEVLLEESLSDLSINDISKLGVILISDVERHFYFLEFLLIKILKRPLSKITETVFYKNMETNKFVINFVVMIELFNKYSIKAIN